MRRNSGFTIFELVMILVIIGILATVVVPNIGQVRNWAARQAALSEMAEIQKAIMGFKDFRGYHVDVGSMPGTLNDLFGGQSGYNPFLETGTRGDYVSQVTSDGDSIPDILQDPWGTAYVWNSSTGVITSLGADGASGGSNENADFTLDVDG